MDFLNLKFCTFNCCSLQKNIDIIRELTCHNYDIILLQETFVTQDKIGILDYIDEKYECIGVPAIYSDKALCTNAGRPEGGLAVMWKSSGKFKIKKVVFENNFIIFNIIVGRESIVLVNTYLNSDLWEAVTLNKYLESLSKLEDILDNFAFNSVIYIGDFNADPSSGRAWGNLSTFMQRNDLKCFDVEVLPPDSITFVGYGNSATRWLDHVVGRLSPSSVIHRFKVLDEFIGSDHLPLEFNLKLNNVDLSEMEEEPCNVDNHIYFVNWKYIRPVELKQINNKINCKMKNFHDMSVLRCNKLGCHDKKHLKEIDDMHIDMVTVIRESAENFKRKTIRKDKFKVIPGWNRNVKHLYRVAREQYLLWMTAGRILGTHLHENMKRSRNIFKTALRNCKLNEHKEICKSITEKFQRKNLKEFWNDVKKQKGILKKTNVIEGETINRDIVNIFADKFFSDQISSNENEHQFLNEFKLKWNTNNKMYIQISPVTLKKLILNLKSGMGHDGVHSLFLKSADNVFLEKLCSFYNVCFLHCYVPNDLLKGIMNPTIKDAKGNMTEAANYRPVMQSSCFLKILEMHLLSILSEKISFNHRQFGFSKGVSTTDTCFLLKEVVHVYSKSKQNGIITFIDLSKAFDKVDHFKLGEILMKENVPIDIVFIIMHYLRNQSAKVVWNDASSDYRPIEWGVRQGGILSPFLFKLYINSVLDSISNLEEGCTMGLFKFNILAYADDIALVASSVAHMNTLYKRLKCEMKNIGLQINSSKTKCLLFGSLSKQNCKKSVILDGDNLDVVEAYKYLGHYIDGTLNDNRDIEHKLMKFHASTNSVLRNFKNVDLDTLLFLFTSYCKPMYGLTLWNNKASFNRSIFKSFNIAFNNSLKRIIGVPLYSSNHVTADICGHLLLQHQIALLQYNYYFKLHHSKSFLIKMNLPFLKEGYFFSYIRELFKNKYDIDVSLYSPDIVKSRIIWVQRHEDRRGSCPYFLI